MKYFVFKMDFILSVFMSCTTFAMEKLKDDHLYVDVENAFALTDSDASAEWSDVDEEICAEETHDVTMQCIQKYAQDQKVHKHLDDYEELPQSFQKVEASQKLFSKSYVLDAKEFIPTLQEYINQTHFQALEVALRANDEQATHYFHVRVTLLNNTCHIQPSNYEKIINGCMYYTLPLRYLIPSALLGLGVAASTVGGIFLNDAEASDNIEILKGVGLVLVGVNSFVAGITSCVSMYALNAYCRHVEYPCWQKTKNASICCMQCQRSVDEHGEEKRIQNYYAYFRPRLQQHRQLISLIQQNPWHRETIIDVAYLLQQLDT